MMNCYFVHVIVLDHELFFFFFRGNLLRTLPGPGLGQKALQGSANFAFTIPSGISTTVMYINIPYMVLCLRTFETAIPHPPLKQTELTIDSL